MMWIFMMFEDSSAALQACCVLYEFRPHPTGIGWGFSSPNARSHGLDIISYTSNIIHLPSAVCLRHIRDRAAMLVPPSLPAIVKTPFYCEENIFLLCEAFISLQEEVSAVFISNELKTVCSYGATVNSLGLTNACQVALWNQKLSKDPGSVVVWDYHVVLLLRSSDGQHWIYDFDTRIAIPCPLKGGQQLNSPFPPRLTIVCVRRVPASNIPGGCICFKRISKVCQ